MHWFYLVLAGVLEIVWSVGLKSSHGMTRPGVTAVTLLAAVASFFLLSLSMKTLPLGTAYAVWTGIGAVGSAVLGMLAFGESLAAGRILGLALIVAGIAALKCATPE